MQLRYILDLSKQEKLMPRHRHQSHRGEPPIAPMPPEPPLGCEGSRSFRLNDFIGLFASGPRAWRGGWGPFSFDLGDEGWSGRGRRARRMFDSGELRLVLLKLISEQPRHGYDLIRAIEELTGGRYAPSPGVVYPTLTMLEEMGLIGQAPGEGARKPYQITEAGSAHLEENEEEADELLRRLKALSPTHSSEGGSP